MVLFNSFYDSKVSKMEAKPARVDLPVEFGSFGGRRTWGSGFFQNIQLVADGCCNLQKQIQIAQLFGVPVIVALNVFK